MNDDTSLQSEFLNNMRRWQRAHLDYTSQHYYTPIYASVIMV